MVNWFTLGTGIYELGCAWATPTHIVITGDPEGPKAPRNHDCKEMGCGSQHVLFRLPFPTSTVV